MLSTPFAPHPPSKPYRPAAAAARAKMMPTGPISSSNHMNGIRGGLEPLARGSQYALHQLQQNIAHNLHDSEAGRNANLKHRQHQYSAAAPGANGRMTATNFPSSSAPVRRRISRACDQCNQLRTKCDGQNPCAHCVEFNLTCEYARERKKRGKASRKDIAQQAAAAAAASANAGKPPNDNSLDEKMDPPAADRSPNIPTVNSTSNFHLSNSDRPNLGDAAGRRRSNGSGNGPAGANHTPSHGHGEYSRVIQSHRQPPLAASRPESSLHADLTDNPSSMGLNTFDAMPGYNPSIAMGAPAMNPGSTNYETSTLSGYADLSYSMQSPPTYQGNIQSPGEAYRLGESPLEAFSLESPGPTGPSWMSLPSPETHQTYTNPLRYPVLQPLLPHLGNLIPVSLACDLLDLYFASSSSAQMHPMSPYVLVYIFRKRSFLHPTQPRRCSPALLASTLWVAAQTSDAAFLTSPPSARGRVCQKLLELTVWLLRPLIHGSPDSTPGNFSDTVINGVALGGLGVAVPGSVGADALTGETGAFGAAGALDDVVTYIHLATVISASEYKGASLRWWNAAWSLSRELKLGRELPPSNHDVDADGESDDINGVHRASTPGGITEEEREERRRIWWIGYTVDRHLSLCYNKPLFLLDVECDGLLQPMDERMWQAGEFDTGESIIHISPNGSTSGRRRGPNFECTGYSIFGFFLPLMTMLGEIVDLNHAKNHPRFGAGFRSSQEWDEYAKEIARQLEAYERSLKEFERKNLSTSNDNSKSMQSPSQRSTNTSSSSRLTTESDVQTKIVIAYGTHVMHVLHILLTGKWDPISLLDDNDLWISSQSFINATGHAVSAAEAIERILEHDPGLEYIPFFFGVYLLQGSFLLLLIADKLQAEASPSVVKACETIVRAHEACVVTLNTEYQRNFRKVMRSALAQVKGRVPEDNGEQQLRRREVLSLYRWVGNGTGLAL